MADKIVCDNEKGKGCEFKKAKPVDYSKLYFDKEIVLKHPNLGEGEFTITLKNIGDFKPDCEVGHFGKNFFFRTNKGMKCGQYKSEAELMKAVERTAKNRGFEVIKWVNKEW